MFRILKICDNKSVIIDKYVFSQRNPIFAMWITFIIINATQSKQIKVSNWTMVKGIWKMNLYKLYSSLLRVKVSSNPFRAQPPSACQCGFRLTQTIHFIISSLCLIRKTSCRYAHRASSLNEMKIKQSQKHKHIITTAWIHHISHRKWHIWAQNK